jgi:hypothetical protein
MTSKEFLKKFKEKDPEAYKLAKRRNILNLLCKELGFVDYRRHWTLKKCKTDSLKYKNPGSWQRMNRNQYMTAQRKGWLEECCKHMEIRRPWTLEACKANALKYQTRYEWQKSSSGAYTAAFHNGWIDECCQHMIKLYNNWTEEKLMIDAEKYNSLKEWRSKSPNAFAAARRKGLLKKRLFKMTTKEFLKIFKEKEPEAYKIAKSRGVLYTFSAIILT